MKTELDVIIVGTGTAALAAASEVKKATGRYIIISNGVYGTTCVRAGCMPSKAFIHGAELYHARRIMREWGIGGTAHLSLDIPALLRQVRTLRAHFLEHTLRITEQYRDHMVEGDAWFLSPVEIKVKDHIFRARSIVLATGSTPIIPEICRDHPGTILTTDTLFEQDDLPETIGVLGLSVLGAEIAQAFAKLGLKVVAGHEAELIGGLSDPAVSAYAVEHLRREMDIHLNDARCVKADTLFVAHSRRANLDNMGLEALGIIQPGTPVLEYNPQTMQVGQLPIFVAGDVKSGRSILNEAAHEGKIAGHNAACGEIKAFRRHTPLQIVHTDPVIAVAGKGWDELRSQDVLVGKASYDDQGCAKLMGRAHGLIHIYADRQSRVLLGAELFAPEGDHLAHLAACLIDRQMTIEEALELPYYHPSLEEGIKSCLAAME